MLRGRSIVRKSIVGQPMRRVGDEVVLVGTDFGSRPTWEYCSAPALHRRPLISMLRFQHAHPSSSAADLGRSATRRETGAAEIDRCTTGNVSHTALGDSRSHRQTWRT